MHFSLVEVRFCESRMYVSFNVQFQILMSHVYESFYSIQPTNAFCVDVYVAS